MAKQPDVKDLKRLRAVEARLEKEKMNVKAMASERRVLRSEITDCEKNLQACQASLSKAQKDLSECQQQVAESAKNVKALQKQNDELEKQVVMLIEENRQLSEQLATSNSDLQQFQKFASEARSEIDAVKKEADEAAGARDEATKQLKSAKAELSKLESELTTAKAQLQQEGKTPLLPPDKVADLLRDLFDRFRARSTGLNVRSGEVKLKVAFGEAGERVGFFVPTADSDPEIKENLHEVTFRFDQSILTSVEVNR